MLSNSYVAATIPVTDIARARKFYEGTLGLTAIHSDDSGNVVYRLRGGSTLNIYLRPTPTKADQTVAAFLVDDVDSAVKDLRSRGVRFEEYDIPEMHLKTVHGIAAMGEDCGAWFKDPDGNILGLFESQAVNKAVAAGEHEAVRTSAFA
jgi:catechol 2,3-dioxygenase-like lactoylglutathione lyase family enzyme